MELYVLRNHLIQAVGWASATELLMTGSLILIRYGVPILGDDKTPGVDARCGLRPGRISVGIEVSPDGGTRRRLWLWLWQR